MYADHKRKPKSKMKNDSRCSMISISASNRIKSYFTAHKIKMKKKRKINHQNSLKYKRPKAVMLQAITQWLR